jgi:predicted aspartyl protease
MIIGQISADREAVIPLLFLDSEEQTTEEEAVLDTGFTDFLTLPLVLIATLRLTFRESVEFVLGDSSPVQFYTYVATVLWDGETKNILVLASEGGPLVGMSMLYGYRVTLDVLDGGAVTIEAKTVR